ncbi:DUF2157 domain-containing protein [Flavihumibacter stibioxidans]|uniref:DUF2157 domain-containing protein n=1 Tax=Flavihumibacter stibioxidans TaxID=1834163 RepID=A0ABR7M816_9BACT|nr:DUF2157 domain-containing protein [Flavihumibacter stibioxidans]MBC6491066.1 hypothetical protein [Flavihumibacter stibioxidans]
MALPFFENLHQQGLISPGSMEKIRLFYAHPRKSVRTEIQGILYIGVLLISTGIGVLVYKHIEQLGHITIVMAILAATLACYGYCYFKRPAFSRGLTTSPSPLFDYILLLGSLLVLILVGYLQSQFQLFGSRWGLASFIPMCILFTTAYFFDHRGVLALAITNLAAWLGITVNRASSWGLSELNNTTTILTASGLGLLLILISFLVKLKNFKAHFDSTYHQFGSHIFFISNIAALIHFIDWWPLWLAVLAGAIYYHLKKAFRDTSFYYAVIAILYGYAGISYLLIEKVLLKTTVNIDTAYSILFYLLLSGISVARLLIFINRQLKENDSILQA